MTETSSPVNEDQALNQAMADAAPILAESLQREERTRRRRRRLIMGGVAMTLVATGIILAVLSGAGDRPTTGDPIERIAQAETLGQEGWELWQQRSFREAAEKFRAAVELDPESTNLWNGLGWSLINSGARDGAKQAFEKCLALEPTHPAAINGMGQITMAAREYEQAIQWFAKAPDLPVAQYGTARAALLSGDYALAGEAAGRALQQDVFDEHSRQILERIQAAADAGEVPADLRAQLEPPAPVKDNEAATMAQRGWELWGQRNFRAAEAAFIEAIKLDPNYANAYNGFGWALLNQGLYEDALGQFEKCLELEPQHIGAVNGLAICLKNTGEVEEAIEVWKAGLELAPGPSALTIGLAQTYMERREYDKAIPLLEQLVEAYPDQQHYRDQLEQARTASQQQ